MTVKYVIKNLKKSSKYAAFRAKVWYNEFMEKQLITEEKLNNLPKETIIMLLLSQNENFRVLSEQSTVIQKQNEQLLKQVEDLRERLAILTQQRFGRRSEKDLPMNGQLSFDLDNPNVLNEAEILTENGFCEEPSMEETVPKRTPRPKGKRAVDLSGIKTTVDFHYLEEAVLNETFPKGWHQLEDEVYKELKRIPASYEVVEHHIGVYAGNGNDSRIIRGESPKRLLEHSILTPSLAASVFTAKYVNAVPLNRISEGYGYDGIHISRQVMAGWMIKLHQYYLEPVHQMMKSELFRSHLIHCDETPFKMTGEKDAKDPQSKDYMWVYHSPGHGNNHPVYLYEYDNGSRAGNVIGEYLKGYTGVLVTDGYQTYHTLQKERADTIKVAGCWVHARRKFADIIKAVKKGATLTAGQKVADEAIRRIAAIYHTDNMYKSTSPKEILDNRQQSVKPLVDAYFAWTKGLIANPGLDQSSALKTALNYSLNQEPYLRTFLEDPEIPLDNNDAERSIKKFCVGKHSWHIIDSKNGAKASAMMYSIAETAKANGLNPFEYFQYLMEQLKEYPRNNVAEDKLAELMPWSETLPDCCKQKLKR